MKGKIAAARTRVIDWYAAMEVGEGIYTNSVYNKPVKLRGMTLPATYNAVNCLKLLGCPVKDPAGLTAFLNSYQTESGAYRIPEIKREELYYPDFEYDDFHITNYVLGALHGIGTPARELAFLREYDTPEKLDAWLARRDMTRPWTEGNYIVNLASFYLYAAGQGNSGYKELFDRLLDWHLHNQDEYGYWHDPSIQDLHSAFAGAAHNFHLFYSQNKPVPRYKKIIDHLLSMENVISTACIDIDVADILAHFHAYGYRTIDIEAYLAKKLEDLLAIQNPDGGFYDVTSGVRLFDGWNAYEEPQGLSNCFATWFRTAAIGLCAVTLYPETRGEWHFCRDIGIGYFNPEYLKGGFDEPTEYPARVYREDKAEADARPCGRELKTLITQLVVKLAGKNEPFVCQFLVENDGTFFLDLISGEKAGEGYRPDADLFVTLSLKTLGSILAGKTNPTVAYALRKIKLKGDVGKAMKLVSLL